MKITTTLTAALCVLAGGLVKAADHEVKMLNSGPDGIMAFEPGYLKVSKGDTVNFVPAEPGHNSASVTVPEGGSTWSGEINKPVSVTLDTEGVYLYSCVPHMGMGMVGVIQVGQATNLDAAKQAAQELSTKIVVEKGRLDKYLAQVN